MDKEKIKSAMQDALYLLNDEYSSVIDEDLMSNYDDVINSLEQAIDEIDKP